MGCCDSNNKGKEKKKDQYTCEACGASSNKAKDCCGTPMKKQE